MNFSKLETFIDSIPAAGVPSCGLIVTKNGETVLERYAGTACRKEGRAASADDLYWIFSATKVLTCCAAMRLIEEGKVHLDDPVSRYIPSFAHLTVRRENGDITPAENTMTLLHLFTMTGGLDYSVDYPAVAEVMAKPESDTLAVVSSFAERPLLFEPGTHYRYSLCHDVLAAVAEVVSGMRFSEYLKKYIFDPLGMNETGFRPTEAQKARFADQYRFLNFNGSAVPKETCNNYIYTPSYESGGAGLFSSVRDYAKFVTLLACGGTTKEGYCFLKPETIEKMKKNYLDDECMKNFIGDRLYGYGWGLCGRVHINPAYSFSLSPVGEFGWDGAAGAFTMIDTENKVALYYGMHAMDCKFAYRVLHPWIRNLVYEGLKD